MAVALANVFGGGSGWRLATESDPLVREMLTRAAAKGEELIDAKITNLARAIRNEIVEAFNGRKGSAGPE